MLTDVARRVTSRQLVGRADELALLRVVTQGAADGAARVVLLSGDAGIGKSRLVATSIEQARRDGFIATLGGCLQLGEVSVAYAPLAEALRELRTQLGEDTLAELLGPGLTDVGALLSGGNAGDAQSSGPLFEHLLGFLTRLSQRQPVLLVFEDLHWADASTRDLVAFLGRNLRDAAVVLLLTYRADDLHRRHPLRPVIADLERDLRVERIVLPGLRRDELARLLGEISDDPASDEVIDELLTRSDGNPFYVEELVAAGGIGHGLPATLSDLILSRVERLSEPAQAVLHVAAVLGDEVDDLLLEQVTGQPATSALREAVSDQVLVIDGDACRFRHALVREALYDDLLPGERERLHLDAARAIEASKRLDEHVRWALLAYHWDAGRMPVKAFAASLSAGQ
jgi:predicted ATPase